jgi:transcriptional regulator with XRE-family HTH domain
MERDPERYGSQSKLAKRTKLDQTSWSHYLRGACIPNRLSRIQIQRTLKIPTESWLIPAKDPRNDPSQSACEPAYLVRGEGQSPEGEALRSAVERARTRRKKIDRAAEREKAARAGQTT